MTIKGISGRARRLLASTTALLSLMVPARADEWTGATSEDWFDPANWADGTVPGAGDPVLVNGSRRALLTGRPGSVSTLQVGNGADGELAIEDELDSLSATLGSGSQATGTVDVQGDRARWRVGGDLVVGAGTGFLDILGGGTVTSAAGLLGRDQGGSGRVRLDGSDSGWALAGALTLGAAGTGTLQLRGGSEVTDADAVLGDLATGQGTADVTGAGSTWTSRNSLVVGRRGQGTLSVRNSGTVSAGSAVLGEFAGASGSITVSEAGSLLDVDSLLLGDAGKGFLTVKTGGRVTSDQVTLSGKRGSRGAASIDGQGSTFGLSGNLNVGRAASGSLSVTGSGAVTSRNGVLGELAGARGTASVEGDGSGWSSDELTVGKRGEGALTVSAGGGVATGRAYVGRESGSRGTVVVSGEGSTLTAATELTIGSAGRGSLTVTGGGRLTAPRVAIAASTGSRGALNVGAPAGETARGAGTLDTGSIAFGNGTGSLNLNHSETGYLVSTPISGPGAVNQLAGTTRLSGANTYTGGTFVEGGTLIVSSTSLPGDLVTNDTTVFEQTNDGTLNGRISGTGRAVKQGAGRLTLAGPSSAYWRVEAGTLASPAGLFASSARLESNGTLRFEQGTDATYAGRLTGTGRFDLLPRNSTLTLTGDSGSFAGRTTLFVGTLAVQGRLGGRITVMDGARLQGNGATGSARVAEGGTIAPGNSIGTLTTGDLVIEDGGAYEVELGPHGVGDRIRVGGRARIAGGTLRLVALPGWRPGASSPILIADDGVEGEFDHVTPDFAFLAPELAYTAGGVTLDLAANGTGFAEVTHGSNQRRTANAVEALGVGDPLYDQVLLLGTSEARAAFDALSGEVHASLRGILLDDSHTLRDAATARLRAAQDGTAAPDMVVLAYNGDGPLPLPAATRFATWGQTFGSWGSSDGGDSAEVERATGGFVLGADTLLADAWRVGALAGYGRTSVDVDDRSSSAHSDDYHLGLYAGTAWGGLALRLGAGHTWHDIDTSRRVQLPASTDRLRADLDAGTTQAFAETGYRIDAGNAAIEPFANLAYVNLHTDGFDEDDGDAALAGRSDTTDAIFTTLGLRASTSLSLGRTTLTARGLLGWRHTFGDTTPDANLAFAGGEHFAVEGAPIARDAAVVEAGIEASLTKTLALGLTYTGQLSGEAQDHGARGWLTVRF